MKKSQIIVGLWVIGFGLLEAVLYVWIDRPLADYTHGLADSQPGLIDFFRSITDLGKSGWYLWPCGVAALVCGFVSRGKDVPPRWRRLCAYVGVRAFFVFATVALSGIAADIVKPMAGRARPVLWLDHRIYGFAPLSFHAIMNGMPSGHTTTVFALAAGLSVFYPRGRFLWFAYAVLIGASRVMVDAHYLSDVAAGAALGWGTVQLFLRHGMIRGWHVIFPIDKGRFQR